MPKQIAAANWKMNLSLTEATQLITDVLALPHLLSSNQYVLFAVPYPYIAMATAAVAGKPNVLIAAQNCSQHSSGAYTGEVSAAMLQSMQVPAVIVGHSERRSLYGDTNAVVTEKINAALAHNIMPLFCCGEALAIRETGTQNQYVGTQIIESLFHLSESELLQVVIAYEPVWAIGTGITATAVQAEEMHAHIRQVLAAKYGNTIAEQISVLYGGSVNAANATEIFSQPNVNGGLVGGAALVAANFNAIINVLK